jgi:transketolase
MRKTFSEITDTLIREDDRTILLLGDIGVFAFQKTMKDFPHRALNFGIMEQSMISFAAGLSKEKFIPIVHTIAPFLVERAYEQLKIDFGYQKLGGNFVSVGASNDYSSLGCTHHCPGDVGNLLNIPDLEIVIPGNKHEFRQAFNEKYNDGKATYFRLSEKENMTYSREGFGKGFKFKDGQKATVLAIGPTLDLALESSKNFDVEVLYLNQINPIDRDLLLNNCKSGKILVVEPYYEGTTNFLLHSIFKNRPLTLINLGVERRFINFYGSLKEMDLELGFTAENLIEKIGYLIDPE